MSRSGAGGLLCIQSEVMKHRLAVTPKRDTEFKALHLFYLDLIYFFLLFETLFVFPSSLVGAQGYKIKEIYLLCTHTRNLHPIITYLHSISVETEAWCAHISVLDLYNYSKLAT